MVNRDPGKLYIIYCKHHPVVYTHIGRESRSWGVCTNPHWKSRFLLNYDLKFGFWWKYSKVWILSIGCKTMAPCEFSTSPIPLKNPGFRPGIFLWSSVKQITMHAYSMFLNLKQKLTIKTSNFKNSFYFYEIVYLHDLKPT